MVKNHLPNAGDARDVGLIPELGRYPGVGNGNPLQYSCLENSMDSGAWWATVHGLAKSRTGLSNYITKTLDWNTIFEKVMHSLTFDQMALRN